MPKSREKVCCERCGRDTTTKDHICNKCRSSFFDMSEQKGRPALGTTLAKTGFDPYLEDYERHLTSTEFYHGDTIRDDL